MNDPLHLSRFFGDSILPYFYERLTRRHISGRRTVAVDISKINPGECDGWYSAYNNSYRLVIRSQGLKIQHEINWQPQFEIK